MTTGELVEWAKLHRDSWPEWGLGAAILALIAEKKAAEQQSADNAEKLAAKDDDAWEWQRRALAAEARVRELEATVRDAVELAEEGWSYASDYFQEKWGYKERIAALRAALAAKGKP